MNILITGTQGIALAIKNVYTDHNVIAISKSTGHDINNVDVWGESFINFDLVFNCAYSGFAQVKVLEFFFNAWKHDASKTIVSIGSRIINQTRTESALDCEYWPYRQHKLALQSVHDSMIKTSKCRLKIINPGPVDTPMLAHVDCKKIDPSLLANKIKQWVNDENITRVDL